MRHNYTRQRQGRDFPKHHSKADEKKSMLERLEHYKAEAERNAGTGASVVPVDGHEPTPEAPVSERGRV